MNGNPPGNVRVAEAAGALEQPAEHEGFEREEVLARGADFIEYAHASGAYVAGLSAKTSRKRLRGLAKVAGDLPAIMREEGVPRAVVTALARRLERLAASLERIR